MSQQLYEIAAWLFGTGLFLLFCWVAKRLVDTLDKLSDISDDHEKRIVRLETINEVEDEEDKLVKYKRK
jgi:hypothetical protein